MTIGQIMKKYLFLILTFLSFLGIGYFISSIETTNAQINVVTNGMSKNTRQISGVKKGKVVSLLHYLDNKYKNNSVILQLVDHSQQNRVLMWSNFDLPALPTNEGKGRYFLKSDFESEIPLAITNVASTIEITQTQGHSYLKNGDQYIAVIGILKGLDPNDERYYLTTGINQPTSSEKLKNYQIIIDGLNQSQLNHVAKAFGGKVKKVAELEQTLAKNRKPYLEFSLTLVLIVITIIINILQAIRITKLSIQSKVHGNLLRRLLTNQTIRDRAANAGLALLALLVGNYIFFFNDFTDYAFIIGLTWLLGTLTFVITVNFVKRKD